MQYHFNEAFLCSLKFITILLCQGGVPDHGGLLQDTPAEDYPQVDHFLFAGTKVFNTPQCSCHSMISLS